jgi:hypothetical protein
MTGRRDGADALSVEIERVNHLSRAMIGEYGAWRSKIDYGDIENALYGDMLDFVNFRIETADTCLLLIEKSKIADALGLSRSIFENYLLLMLMCRGTKYFLLQDLSTLSEGDFKARLKTQESELQMQQAQGTTRCLYVKRYPRPPRRNLMYVFEGLKVRDQPDFVVPVHYFHFHEFFPETLRLKDENYFQYHEPSPELKKSTRAYQQETESRYKHYLSYDALLQCLEINDLADAAVLARIEAHYTFLGKFLHPTYNAARDLHERHNVYAGETTIGMSEPYTKAAVLLASLYVCYIVAGLLDEIAGLLERAPSKYMRDAGTRSMRNLTANVAAQFTYFWFLYNDPPLYDKFNYCSTTHVSNEELAEWGHCGNVPKERVPFDQYIYSHLQHALNGWSNRRCGEYRSPLS